MPHYTHLLFDLDGTLFDFDAAEKNAFQQTCHKFHLPYSDELMQTYTKINDSYWKLFEQKKITQSELTNRRFADIFDLLHIEGNPYETNRYYRHCLGNSSQMFPDALPICRTLSQTYQIALITNGVADVQQNRLSKTPLLDYVCGVFISDVIGIPKPQKEYFDYVYSKLDILPSQALVIGDSLTSDILGAQNAKTDSCWYNPHFKENPYPHIVPTFEISSLPQLITLLSTLSKCST